MCVCAHFSLQESLEEESPEYYSYSLSLDDGIIVDFFFISSFPFVEKTKYGYLYKTYYITAI